MSQELSDFDWLASVVDERAEKVFLATCAGGQTRFRFERKGLFYDIILTQIQEKPEAEVCFETHLTNV